MGTRYNPIVVTRGLKMYVDPANSRSYSGTGTNLVDLTGNGFDGTLVGGVTYNSDNWGYFQLDGSTGYIDFASQPDLNDSSFTVGAWFKTTDTDMRIIQNCNTGGFGAKNGFQISVTNSTFSNTAISNTSGSFITFDGVSSTPYVDFNWHQVTLTYDNAVGRGSLYLDGVLLATDVDSGLIGTNMNGTGLEIGRSNSGLQYLNGIVSAAFVYDVCLDSTEIKQNFDALKGRYGL